MVARRAVAHHRLRARWCIHRRGACCSAGTRGCRRGCRSAGTAIPGETSPFLVATREAVEETGLARSGRVARPAVPWLVHVVIVPVPAARGEEAHEHADFRYVLATASPDAIVAEDASARAPSGARSTKRRASRARTTCASRSHASAGSARSRTGRARAEIERDDMNIPVPTDRDAATMAAVMTAADVLYVLDLLERGRDRRVGRRWLGCRRAARRTDPRPQRPRPRDQPLRRRRLSSGDARERVPRRRRPSTRRRRTS